MNKRTHGKVGEEIALHYYLADGYSLVERNYTIRGGEIDLILRKGSQLVFIEVKIVDGLDDVHEYITTSKLKHLTRSINRYAYSHASSQFIQLDVVLIKEEKVWEIYRNVTLYT